MPGPIGEAFVRIRPNTSGFRTETQSGVERALSSVRVRTRVFTGVTAAATGVAGLGAAFIQGARTAVDFDRGLRNVNSIAHLTDDSLKRVGTSIHDISETSGRGPKELVSALYDVVSSGFSARDALVVLNASSKAATAGLSDAATSTRAIDAALNAYHLTANQATKVSDVLFQVVNKGVLTFEELAQNMGDLVPAAAPLGVSLEEVGSAIATITLQGVPAAEAATRVKNTMLQLASPSKALAGLLRENGFASGEAAVRSLGYAGVLDLITKATGGSVTETSKLFPEIRSLLGVVGLTGRNAATYTNVLNSMGEATKGVGATQRAFAEQAKSVGFQWDKTKAILARAAIDVGEEFFPAMQAGAHGLQAFAHGFESAKPTIAEFGHAIGEVIHAVEPVAAVAVHAIGGIAGAVHDVAGAGGILAFAAGFKALSVATGIQTAVQTRYLAVTRAGQGVTAGAAAAEVAETEAVTAGTAALVANTAALEANAAATVAAGTARLRFAATSVSTGIATAAEDVALLGAGSAATGGKLAGLTTRLGTLGRGLFTLSGGMTTVASIGLAGLGFGIFKLATEESGLEKANHRLQRSLDDLGTGLVRARGLAKDLGDALSTVHSDRVAIQVSRANVQLAQQALHTTKAAKGTAEYSSLVANLASAEDGLRTALRTLSQDQERASGVRRDKAKEDIANEGRVQQAIQDTISVGEQAALRQRATGAHLGSQTGSAAFDALSGNAKRTFGSLTQAANAAKDFANQLDKDAASASAGTPAFRHQLEVLAEFTRELGHLPTRRQIEMILKAPNPDAAISVVQDALVAMNAAAKEKGFASGAAWAKQFAAGIQGGLLTNVLQSPVINEGIGGSAVGKAVLEETVKSNEEQLKKISGSLEKVGKNMKSAAKDLKTATEDLATSNERLADTIRSGHEAVESAISQADQNLFSIGDSLTNTVGEFLDALNKTDQAAQLTPNSKLFKKLRQQIIEGAGGPETRRAAEELAQKIESAQASASGGGRVEKLKEQTGRQIKDLVDQFNKGAISLATFNKRVAAILARDGISYKRAGKVNGIAFADGFKAELEGLKAQAAAIAAGPRRPGRTGQEPDIVHPLQVLHDSQRDIAKAQKERDDAAREVAKDQRHLESLSEKHQRLLLQEARQNTDQLKALRKQLAKDAKATRDALKTATGASLNPRQRAQIDARHHPEAGERARAAASHGFTP